MPQAIVDPDELERFASSLARFNEQLRQNTSNLSGHFNNLGSTWRDSEYQKFAKEFQQTKKALNQFMKSADAQIPKLRKKAKLIRSYLQSS